MAGRRSLSGSDYHKVVPRVPEVWGTKDRAVPYVGTEAGLQTLETIPSDRQTLTPFSTSTKLRIIYLSATSSGRVV